MQHPRHDQGAGDAGVACAEADIPQDFFEAELLQGLQAESFAADRARILVLEAVEVDIRRLWRSLRLFETSGAELSGYGPGRRVELGIDFQHALLARHLHLQNVAELAPALLRHGEAGSEIEQGDLADLAADALRFHEPVAVGGLAAFRMGFRRFDIHEFEIGRSRIGNQGRFGANPNFLSLQSKPPENPSTYRLQAREKLHIDPKTNIFLNSRVLYVRKMPTWARALLPTARLDAR